MRMQQSIAAIASLAKAAPVRASELCGLADRCWPIGAWTRRLRAVARPWRAGAGAGDLADGQSAISGSFDSTAIRWSLTRNAAEQVLRFHADAVNAVALLGMDARRPPAPMAASPSGPRQDRARRGAGRPHGADRRAGGIA
jgi:hypothetical protein